MGLVYEEDDKYWKLVERGEQKMKTSFQSAVDMAYEAHAGKTWYAGLAYTEHLRRVEEVILKYCDGKIPPFILQVLRSSAWLHDAVEDCGVTVDQIKKKVGPEVAALVWAVTDEPGANRKERHEKTYPKIRNIPHAVKLKLADRIVNVEASAYSRGGYFDMYRKEHYDFKRALCSPDADEVEKEMWRHLDLLLSEDPSKKSAKLADEILVEVQKVAPLLPEDTVIKLRRIVAGLIETSLKKE